MGLCLKHSSPGKNSILNAPVLLKGAEMAFVSGGKGWTENALQKRAALRHWPFLFVQSTKSCEPQPAGPVQARHASIKYSYSFSLSCASQTNRKAWTHVLRLARNAPNRNKYTCNTYITFCLTLNTCKLLLSTHLHTVKLRGVEYYITFYKWHHFSYILIILQIIPCISIATWGKKSKKKI